MDFIETDILVAGGTVALESLCLYRKKETTERIIRDDLPLPWQVRS